MAISFSPAHVGGSLDEASAYPEFLVAQPRFSAHVYFRSNLPTPSCGWAARQIRDHQVCKYVTVRTTLMVTYLHDVCACAQIMTWLDTIGIIPAHDMTTEVTCTPQGYLAHKKMLSPSTLQEAYI